VSKENDNSNKQFDTIAELTLFVPTLGRKILFICTGTEYDDKAITFKNITFETYESWDETKRVHVKYNEVFFKDLEEKIQTVLLDELMNAMYKIPTTTKDNLN